MALGKILRESREKQGFTVTQVADATHMMIQIVEELESEDFHRIAAPIYGRGFIKLYSEFLGINPAPLLDEFNEIYSGARRPPVATRALKSLSANLIPAAPPAPAATAAPAEAAAPAAAPVFSAAAPVTPSAPAMAPVTPAPAAAGAAVQDEASARVLPPSARPQMAGETSSSATADALDDLFKTAGGASARRDPDSDFRLADDYAWDDRAPASVPHDERAAESTSGGSPAGAFGTRCRAAVDTIVRCGREIHYAATGGLRRLWRLIAGWRKKAGTRSAAPAVLAAAVLILAAGVLLATRRGCARQETPVENSTGGLAPSPAGIAPLEIKPLLPPPEPYGE